MRLNKLWCKLTAWNVFVLITAVFVLHNELLIYCIYYSKWPNIDKSSADLTILLVADSQIVGYEGESPFAGFITRRDNYHYLWLTHYMARYYIQPDATWFLGDLIDEGSTCDEETYETYVQIFTSIYGSPRKAVYIPGDNDIGGEAGDPITWKNVHRFAKHFGSTTSVTQLKYLNIIKFSKPVENSGTVIALETLVGSMELSSTNILLNHENILPFYIENYKQVLERLDVSLIISGHVHQSHLVACRNCFSKERSLSVPVMEEDQIKFQISTRGHHMDTIAEIVVPTCSYRMGETRMAFGVLQLSETGQVTYSLLWLPPRLSVLRSYYIVLLLLFALLARHFVRYIVGRSGGKSSSLAVGSWIRSL